MMSVPTVKMYIGPHVNDKNIIEACSEGPLDFYSTMVLSDWSI